MTMLYAIELLLPGLCTMNVFTKINAREEMSEKMNFSYLKVCEIMRINDVENIISKMTA